MSPRFALLLAVTATLTTAACGDLSEEDLVFRVGVPAKRNVELQPAGEVSTADDGDSPSTTSQPLSACGDGDLRCNVRDTAKGFNGLTFGLLDLVDRISSNPPTTRKKGVRVWGPFYDPPSDVTGRFEISRNQDGVSFSFCLHAVRGRIRNLEARDITCDTDVDADTGLAEILSGDFTPSGIAGAQARDGVGTMGLRIDRVPDLAQAIHAHDMVIAFNNTEGRHIGLTINGAVGLDGNELPPITYTFDRDVDGSGDLSFDVFSPDVAPEHPGNEEARIDARWEADQGGRAVAHVTTSDGSGATFTEDQCWDKHVGTVYTHVVGNNGNNTPTGDNHVGDSTQCAFACADFASLGQSAVDNCNAAP